ncbi:MAG: M24 family metallopeptidase [Alphaproteobacteria bacterium]
MDHPFSREEFAGRIRAVQTRMQERGMDVLVVADPSNMYYLTGYNAWSFYTPQALLVSLDSETPIWCGRFMDATSAHRTTYLPADAIRPYPDSYVQASDRHPMQIVAGIIEKEGWSRKTIGIEMDAYYYTAHAHEWLAGALPNAKLVDAGLMVAWVRVVKSPQELTYLREAGQIVERMMDRAFEVIRPGLRECDLAGALYEAQMRGTEAFGGIHTTSPPFLGVGRHINEPHPVWNDDPIAANTPVNIEIAGCRLRYHGPMSRTIYVGKPPQTYRDLADGVVEGMNAALDAVKPGVTCETIEAVWRRTIARRGIEKEARLGYSIGIGFPPTWGERTASLRPGDLTVLEAGMAFHMMSGIWQKETGVTITQAFYVTDTGHQPLTSAPRALLVKD